MRVKKSRINTYSGLTVMHVVAVSHKLAGPSYDIEIMRSTVRAVSEKRHSDDQVR